jgi:hypothetical protein
VLPAAAAASARRPLRFAPGLVNSPTFPLETSLGPRGLGFFFFDWQPLTALHRALDRHGFVASLTLVSVQRGQNPNARNRFCKVCRGIAVRACRGAIVVVAVHSAHSGLMPPR